MTLLVQKIFLELPEKEIQMILETRLDHQLGREEVCPRLAIQDKMTLSAKVILAWFVYVAHSGSNHEVHCGT